MTDLPCDVEPQSVPGAGRCTTVPETIRVKSDAIIARVSRVQSPYEPVFIWVTGATSSATCRLAVADARAVAAAINAQCDAIEGGAP